jgi:uncharacterized protein (TIGR02996 family)
MNDDDAVQRAIAESAGDDTTDLVYADWLEERNDPRASLIRAWFELRTVASQVPDSPTDPYFYHLKPVIDAYRECAASVDREWLWKLGAARPWIGQEYVRAIVFFNLGGHRKDWPKISPDAANSMTRAWLVSYRHGAGNWHREGGYNQHYLVHQYLGTVAVVPSAGLRLAVASLERTPIFTPDETSR